MFAEQLEILNWKKELAYARTDIAFLDKNLEKIAQEEIHILECQRILIGLRNLFFQLLIQIRKDVSVNEAQKAKLQKIADNELLKVVGDFDYHRIEVMRLRLISVLHFANSNAEEFYETSKILVKKMEANAHFLKEDVSEYISAINNHLVACGKTRKFKKVQNYLGKLADLQPITKDDELKIHRQYYMNKFRFCLVKGDFNEGLSALKGHIKAVEKYPAFSFSKNSFYNQYFNIYFGVGDFEKALYYLNEWLNQPRNVERQDLQAISRILNLLIHFEMGNTMLLDSLMRSTKRYLRKEKRIYQFELKIMEFFNKMSKPLSKNQQKEAMQKLKIQFDELLKEPREARMMQMFNFQAWIESKITKESFPKIVQKQYLEMVENKD